MHSLMDYNKTYLMDYNKTSTIIKDKSNVTIGFIVVEYHFQGEVDP